MTQVTNLNKFRKARAKAEKEKRAQNNRILFGTPKALKNLASIKNAKDAKSLEEKKLKSENED